MRTYLSIPKPIFILAIFLSAFTIESTAQGFKMGLSVTPNVSWMTSTDYDHVAEGKKMNFGFEFNTDIMFNETYAFGTGIHIFNTGGSVNYLVVDQENEGFLKTVERNYMLKYVEVPLTFKLRTKEMGYSTIYGRFGLGLGMNIRAEANEASYRSWVQNFIGTWDQYNIAGDHEYQMEDVQSDVKLFRSSMIVGGGVERSMGGESSLIIGVNYNVAFLNTHKDVEQVRVGSNGSPTVVNGLPDLGGVKGHDSTIELVLGLLF